MIVSFFEEYSSELNLNKLKLIHFSTNLYIGCKDINQFLQIRNRIKKNYQQVKQVIYWPILKLEEGYWLSGFTKTEGIMRILEELKKTKENFPILWDAELPTLNKKLFITQLPNLITNRKLIYGALLKQSPNHPLIVAQFSRSGLQEWFSQIGATSFPFANYHRLDMLYSSMMKNSDKSKFIRETIYRNKRKYKQYSVGFGLLDRGEGDPTPLITPNELDRDMRIAKTKNIREVVIYRLGGLNENYLRVLEKFSD